MKRLNFEEHAILTEVIGGRGHRHFQDHHSLSLFNDTLITFAFAFCLSFLLFLFPHRQVTIESDPNIGKLPTLGSLAKPSWIFFENVVPLSLSLSLSLPSSSHFLSPLLSFFLSFSFSFFLSFPLCLYPHRQVTIESDPNVGRLPTLGSLAKPSWTRIGLCFENVVPLSFSLSLSFSPSFPFLSPFLFLFLYFSFCFFLSFPLFLSPHRQVTIESDPNMEKLPGFRFTQSISPIFFVLTLFLRLRVTCNITKNCRKLFVLFLICYASTPLALQLHQDCIKVVRSNGVIRKRPARGH